MFREENGVYKIVGRVFAVIFSIVLVVSLITASAVTAARSLLRAEVIISVAKSYASEKFVSDDESFGDVFEHVSDDAKLMDDILGSDTFREVLDLYLDDTVDALAGETFAGRFTADRVDDIFKDHKDELTGIIARNGHTSDEDAAELVDQFIEERLPGIVGDVPSPAAFASDINERLLENGVQLHAFFSGGILWILWGAAAVFAALILLCRLFRFRGLKWIGADALIAAVFLYPAALALSSGLLPKNPAAAAIYAQLGRSILLAAVILTAAGILLIGVNIALHFVFRRRFDRCGNAVTLPAPPGILVAEVPQVPAAPAVPVEPDDPAGS